MTNWDGSGGSWGVDAPIWDTNLECKFGGRTWPYPDVWITVQSYEPTETQTGRACIWHYTPDADPDGSDALSLGGGYYDEGMACDPYDEREKRIRCFQAAELLYLHASSKGNHLADLCLGYVYSYDRCEGEFWNKPEPPDDLPWAEIAARFREGSLPKFDHDGAALLHFRKAAEAGMCSVKQN